VLDAAMSRTGSKTFAAYLLSASSHEIADLRLGKKTDELYAHAETPQDQIDRYASCSSPPASTSTGLPARAHYVCGSHSPGGAPLQRAKRLTLEILTRFTPSSGRDAQ
jgi:hypothetical protein